MNEQENVCEQHDYRIEVEGHLDPSWSVWLDSPAIRVEVMENTSTPVTVLTCFVKDQPGLRGLLIRLFDMNITLLSVNRSKSDAGKEVK